MEGVSLSELDEKKVWDWIYEELSFKPSVRPIDWPSITTRKRHFKFKIDSLWGTGYSEQKHSNFIQQAIEAFIEITTPGEEIYALDWQHDCYYFDPRKLSASDMLYDDSSVTNISFIPDGDYYIFLAKDFENIWFGHPWEKTITVIGDRLIDAVKSRDLFIN
jgi:hypothetical protein